VPFVASCASDCDVQATVWSGATAIGSAATHIEAGERPLLHVSLDPTVVADGRSRPLTLRAVFHGSAGGRRTLARKFAAVRAGPAVQAPVGISDQQPGTFDDPRFRLLGVEHARYITPWDSVLHDRSRLNAWMRAATAAGVDVHVAFGHSAGDRCPGQPCTLPSVRAYARAVRAFLRRYPEVRSITPWNEANHRSQPTAYAPARAAAYYEVVRAACRGCRVVAADVLDTSNLTAWIAAFRASTSMRPRLWGLHNYGDANHFRSSGTEAMLRAVPGQVWLTETGGIVRFQAPDGRLVLPPSEARAARALRFLLAMARTHSDRITRAYVYQWRITNPGDRFDAGLVRPDGRPRPGLGVLSESIF
jgi:hypothetical protein